MRVFHFNIQKYVYKKTEEKMNHKNIIFCYLGSWSCLPIKKFKRDEDNFNNLFNCILMLNYKGMNCQNNY